LLATTSFSSPFWWLQAITLLRLATVGVDTEEDVHAVANILAAREAA